MEERSKHLEKLGEHWAAAERRGDTEFLACVLANDFVAVGPRGFMLTKERWLSRHDSENLVCESFDWDEVRVRIYGCTAVMTGRETAKGRYEDGDVRHEIWDQLCATLIFAEGRETWLSLGLHLSPIAGPLGGRS